MLKWKSAAMAVICTALALYLAGCAAPAPKPAPLAEDSGQTEAAFGACLAVYKQSAFTTVHRIEGDFGGRRVTLMGAIKADPVTRRIEAVLLSPEGAVLFDGSIFNGNVDTNKALPPFDAKPFAKALLDDVDLMLLPPDGGKLNAGVNADGKRACRWGRTDGGMIEVSLDTEGGWRTLLYDKDNKLIRDVTSKPPMINGLASEITLKAHGRNGYSLKATLIEQ